MKNISITKLHVFFLAAPGRTISALDFYEHVGKFWIFFFDSRSIPGVPGPILGGPGPSKPALGLKTRFC